MELLQAIERRTSVRRFKDKPVELDDLKEIVRRAGLAPSVNNSQQWKFILVTKKEAIQELAELVRNKIHELFPHAPEKVHSTVEYFSTIFEKAPTLLLIAQQPFDAVADDMLHEELTHDMLNQLRGYPDVQSIGAAVQNILLSAVDLGYGACWLSGMMVASEELQQHLKIEKPYRLVTAVAIGHIDGEPKPTKKKALDEIIDIRNT